MATVINAIDKSSIHKICSGQVVLDLATAVKELVENSIDAGASSVEVAFKENGVDGLEVIDDGSGIDPLNYETIALKHYTSKLNSFEDLEKVLTFGFRGEALSSLCALSHLTVITATKEQAPMGVKLEFDENGCLTSKTPVSRTAGTTIQLSNIFHSLPVRQAEFKRNIKREYGKALTILQAYSIISTNIRISVANQNGGRASIKIMSTSKNKDTSANISNIFGAKLVSQITPFKIDLESVFEAGCIEGFISKPEWGMGRSSSDRQYLYVNGRPCMLPRLAKALNEIYRVFISNQYPVVVADLKIPTDSYDVNVSPDKRTIFIHEESKIIDCITEQLKEQLEPSRSTFQVNALMMVKSVEVDDHQGPESKSTPSSSKSALSSSSMQNIEDRSSSSVKKIGDSPLSKVRTIANLGSFAMSNSNSYSAKTSSTAKRSYPTTTTSTLLKYMSKKPKTEATLSFKRSEVEDMEVDELREDDEIKPKEQDDDAMEVEVLEKKDLAASNDSVNQVEVLEKEDVTESADSTHQVENEDSSELGTIDSREYVEMVTGIKSYSGLCKTVGRTLILSPIDFTHLKQAEAISSTKSPVPTAAQTILKNASVKNTDDNEKATKALSRVISKPDFARMQVLGQFNLGFMITSLDDQDLYIVDQHASDEKYNFETLQQTTQIKGQRLLSSSLLDLTAAEELTVMDNIDIFKANGFDVEILPDNEPTKRIRVISQPVSKNTMFDRKDFSEIIHLINEHPGEMVRCSRIRSMFASRACHKAVRIGDSLTKPQMTKIIRHMGEIDQPWNCPHGRPTMRHLLNLAQYKQEYPSTSSQKRPLSFTGTLFLNK